MNTDYKIWTNTPDSARIKAFKSALTFRKNEVFRWTDDPRDSELWVIDPSSVDISRLADVYRSLIGSPRVAIIGKHLESQDILPEWHQLPAPINLPSVFRWLDESLMSEISQVSQVPSAPTATAEVSGNEPWKDHDFKLKRWPNVSKYGSKAHIAVTCSNLLRDFHNFNSALQWGLPDPLLNQILHDAHHGAFLELKEEPRKNQAALDVQHSMPVDNKASLIAKLMNRFK